MGKNRRTATILPRRPRGGGATVMHRSRCRASILQAMTATVRLGTCSWADEGLLKAWYPRGVSTAAARLRYYAERFDVVEVDSPFYALPDPDVTRRWAERTPDEFTFHVKAGAAMTFH